MLIVVNSAPKCGSTWLHNFIVRCLERLGHPKPHDAVRDYGVWLNDRANPWGLHGDNLRGLLRAARHQTFAIKAHQPPHAELLEALRDGSVASVYLIRHPTSIAQSTLAFAEFCRARPDLEPGSPYAKVFTPEDAFQLIVPHLEWAAQWLASDQRAIVARYEDVFSSDAGILGLAMRMMGISDDAVPTGVLSEMHPASLSVKDRDHLRVNLVRKPQLSPAVERQCDAWAQLLGITLRAAASTR